MNASTITLASQAGVVSPKGDEQSKQLGDSIVSDPRDRNLKNAKAVPLPASPDKQPSASPGKASPSKVGRHLDDEDTNSTSHADVFSPKGDDPVKQSGYSPDSQDEHPIQSPPSTNNHQQTISPIEDAHGEPADGVDHYDLRNHKLPLEEGENGNELANNNFVGSAGEERRGTLEDAKGVLYHGAGVGGGIGEKKMGKGGAGGEGKGEDDSVGVGKPKIDRSDTASLD